LVTKIRQRYEIDFLWQFLTLPTLQFVECEIQPKVEAKKAQRISTSKNAQLFEVRFMKLIKIICVYLFSSLLNEDSPLDPADFVARVFIFIFVRSFQRIFRYISRLRNLPRRR